MNIVKGTRVRAQWFTAQTDPPACLAGVQMKFVALGRDVTGTIRHFRGNDPMNPTVIQIFIDADGSTDIPTTPCPDCTCGHDHIAIKPDWIVGVVP